MAVAQNTVIIDDVEYKPGEQLPQLGSIHRVFKDGGKRHYEGLAKDSDKLPLYVANNSSCFMTDTGEYYKFDESKKLWYKPDKIEQSKVTAIEVYGVLNGKIQQVSEDVEGIATPLLYKGSVSDISQLPLSPKIGWMYNISEKSIYGEAGMNVAWTGEIWDTLGPAIDMAPYLREDSEIITSLKTKTENLESANYTDRGTLADTDAFLINDGTGMKKSVLSKLSDFVLNKIADKVFAKLQTNDKTILGAINELNSKTSTQEITIPKSGSVLKKCLNCLILIVGTNTQMYDLYACIGYQSDSVRSTIKLLAGAGNHKITYADNDTSESRNGIYTITNGSSNVDVKATIIPLQR
jgi:hypothetical protein|nr:MAG TPA: hypothetical protein [Bacteriophage sp.]